MNSSIEQLPEITIKQYTPSEVTALARLKPEIADHIIAGYGIPQTDKSKEQIVEEEYDHGENRTAVFLAEINGEVVGSLYFILWRNNQEDKRGGRLLNFLTHNDNGLIDVAKLSKYEMLACDVGIVVHPDFQGKGVAGELYRKGIEAMNPAFLVGQTKTPGAVIARSRVLAVHNYVTSYAGIPVSLNLPNNVAEFLTEAFYYAKHDVIQRVPGKFIHYAKTESLQPEIKVDQTKLNATMRSTFSEIITADLERPEGFITFAPMISVVSDLVN